MSDVSLSIDLLLDSYKPLLRIEGQAASGGGRISDSAKRKAESIRISEGQTGGEGGIVHNTEGGSKGTGRGGGGCDGCEMEEEEEEEEENEQTDNILEPSSEVRE